MFNTIPELLQDVRAGKMVILVDDESRENEGDLVIAGQKATPENINFMMTHARGLVCVSLSEEKCRQLDLPLMVKHSAAHYGTPFTVSVDAAEGITTGVSAFDKAKTIRALANPTASAHDVVRPGHIFPLMAKKAGVFERAGHTEGSNDLVRLAGFEPCAVIAEILNPDGSMARRPELLAFAAEHGLKIATIKELIAYRYTLAEQEELTV